MLHSSDCLNVALQDVIAISATLVGPIVAGVVGACVLGIFIKLGDMWRRRRQQAEERGKDQSSTPVSCTLQCSCFKCYGSGCIKALFGRSTDAGKTNEKRESLLCV